MKIKDLIVNLDRSESTQTDIDLDDLACQFNLYSNFKFDYEQTRLTSYWVRSWMCTDTWVGYKVYFFDDIPVAFSSQTARKSSEEIEWVSEDAYRKVKEYISSFAEQEPISILNLEEEIPDTYKISYASQWLNINDTALFNSKEVKVLRRQNFRDWDNNNVIILLNGMETVVNIKDLDFRYNLKGYCEK